MSARSKPAKEKDVVEHPRLGRFYSCGLGWGQRINVPAFDAFCWPTKYREPVNPAGRYGLAVCGTRYGAFPTAEGWKMVEQVLKRPEQVVKLVVEALWNDFNGTGSDSGMWWHGNLSKVAQYAKSAVPKLESPEDLLRCLRLEGLALAYHFYSKPAPLIDLMFWPAFEYEHGLGVLTDGKSIVGIGYSLDVEPFRRKRRSKRCGNSAHKKAPVWVRRG